MKNLRSRFERFCYKNRNKGIPNLMLYIAIGCGLVTVTALLGYPQIYSLLCFDRAAILQGQVWRLITPVFTMGSSNILTALILLYCFYSLGRAVENAMGILKFNLYWLSGILLMDIFALAFGSFAYVFADGQWVFIVDDFSYYFSSYIPLFLLLSMTICFSTIYPETQFLVLFILPIKARILSLFYLAYMIFEIVRLCVPTLVFPLCLFPLVAILNYFLFFGKDVANLFPARVVRKKPKNMHMHKAAPSKAQNYTHRCTVCGKTDVTNPELEFRYCSRCNGYFCYCQDHINNHTHVE